MTGLEEYKKFLIYEKKNSIKFLEEIGIFEDRFIESDYVMIKFLFTHTVFINSVYNVIDELIKYMKLDVELRHLVMCDFLFAMSSKEYKNPSDILLETTRTLYISRIRLRASINLCFGIDYYEYIKLHQKLLIGLRLAEIISKKEIRILGSTWTTIVCISINNIKNNEFIFNYWYSNKPFLLKEINGISYSIGSFRNIWKVKRKKKEMETYSFSYKGVEKANHLGLTLCKKNYDLVSSHIIKEKENILNECGCQNIKEYFDELVKVIRDKKYISIMKKNKKEINIKYGVLLKNFQKIISFHLLKENIFDFLFYLPCFVDNRGRQYYATILSPTFYKLFRYLYEFNTKKTEFEQLEQSTFYKKVMTYKYLIDEWKLSDLNCYILIIMFIEIGKIYINKKIFMGVEELVNCGIINYKQKKMGVDFNDNMYIEKVYSFIDNIVYKNIIDYNFVMFKDATASGLQNYGMLLGYKKDKLKFLNIDGDEWCDTYSYLIDKFLKTKNDKIKKRKYWKKTIMTIPYNAVWYQSFIYFLDELRKDNIDYVKLSKNEQIELRELHKKFYIDIKEKIKEEFYISKENVNLEKFNYLKWNVVSVHDYKITYKKERDKYRNTLYMLSNDEKKTLNALEANNMHNLDWKLMFFVMSSIDVIGTHDCFAIRLCELHKLIDLINEYYSKKIGFVTYSIFIVI